MTKAATPEPVVEQVVPRSVHALQRVAVELVAAETQVLALHAVHTYAASEPDWAKPAGQVIPGVVIVKTPEAGHEAIRP